MFTVEGYLDRIPYTIVVDPSIVNVTDNPDVTDMVSGSNHVMSLLRTRAGKDVMATPTGPLVTVALDDPTSILGSLYALTQVVKITGDAPNVFESIPGVVY